jgi:hypothetical protein
MKREQIKYLIGPELTVFGKKPLKQIKRAFMDLAIPFSPFGVAWIAKSINPAHRTFYITCDDTDHISSLPVNFAEAIQDILKVNPFEG